MASELNVNMIKVEASVEHVH